MRNKVDRYYELKKTPFEENKPYVAIVENNISILLFTELNGIGSVYLT